VERFIHWGLAACGEAVAGRYPALAGWRGLSGLKEKLRLLAGAPAGLPGVMASRSAVVMRVAAKLPFHPCKNVLVSRWGWGPYPAILEEACHRAGRRLTVVQLRDDALSGQLSSEEVTEWVKAVYLRERCDGVFLTGVSNLGVRLPVARIVETL